MVVSADFSDFTKLAKDLRKAAPEVSKALNRELKAAGEIIAEEARRRSSWSSKIPRTIKTRRAGTSVKVIAGGPAAPYARPYEHGGQPGSFRHPVYGNRDVWVQQTARPFLGPAASAKQDEAVAEVMRIVDETLRKYRL